MSPNTVKAPAVDIKADEVSVTHEVSLPEGHVVTEPPTAATPPIVRPATDVRDAEVAAEKETHLRSQAARDETVLRTQGQRDTSFMWEGTQMRLALMNAGGFMWAHLVIVMAISYILITDWQRLSENPAALTPLVVILTATLGSMATQAASVSATYFNRTNSHKIGGVGKDYEGR